MKPAFQLVDYVVPIGTKSVKTIQEIEFYEELNDYVYYTTDGLSFGENQLEPMELVYKREYEMTCESQIEEILMESHSYGLRREVMETAKEIMSSNHKIDRLTAYELAYREWVK
jgi:hypothetical protein